MNRVSSFLGLPLRLAFRDLKGGLAGFRVFIACIILGVTAIVGVGSTARSLVESLSREGQRILGGDASFSTVLREIGSDERAWFAQNGEVSVIAGMRAMARRDKSGALLVEIKAVDDAYPSIGSAVLDPPAADMQQVLRRSGDVFGIAGDEALAARLELKVGDSLMIGDARFIWRGIVKSEPDKLAGGFSLGPRVIMSIEALRSSGLVQPGSLVRWTYRVKLPEQRAPAGTAPASQQAVENFTKATEQKFPDAGWRVATRERISPNFSRNLERFTQFLTLIGLTALIIGGIGIANAVRGFVNRKRADFAVLKALGASGSYVFLVSMTEVLVAAAIGIAIGLVVGIALPYMISGAFGAIMPVPFVPSIHVSEIALGIAYGFLAAILFSLAPLGQVHDTPVSTLFRDEFRQEKVSLRLSYKVMIGALSLVFIVVIMATATDRRSAIIFVSAAALILASLHAIGFAVAWGVRRLPHAKRIQWRLAIANLGRPGALTRPVIASVGLGLSLFVTLSVIDSNLREPLRQGIPGQTPSFFFTDIQSAQSEKFSSFLKERIPQATIEMAPMLRGRVTQVNGVEAKSVRARENVAWVLEGDRGITFASEIPAGSRLVGGKWWPADYSGPPLVSIEAEAAEGLGLKLGDTVSLNILGRNITAEIANLREVNWRSYGINFVFVFTPATFRGAPYASIATATFPDGGKNSEEIKLVGELASAFPTISTVRLKETLDAVAAIARQLGFAIRSATVVALIASILVLAGALAAGQSARIYDTVVLKVLGATRGRLIGALLIEFTLLGVVTALFALIAGSITAWVILDRVLRVETFEIDWSNAVQTTLLSLLIVVVLGLAGTWRALGQSPAARLRSR